MEEQSKGEVVDNTELLLREIEKKTREVIYRTRDDELYSFASEEEMFYRARFLAYCEIHRNKAKKQIVKELKEYGWSIKNVSFEDIKYDLDSSYISLKIYDRGHVVIDVNYPLTHLTKEELIRTYEIFRELLKIHNKNEEKAEEFNRRKRREHYKDWHKKIDATTVEEMEKQINRMSQIFRGE